MDLFFTADNKAIDQRNKHSGYNKEPDIPGRCEICKFPQQILSQAACEYQPTPEEKVEAALADVYFCPVDHFRNDLKTLFT